MDAPVLPVFIRDRDILYSERSALSPFKLCKAVASCITVEEIEGCQKIGALWRVYLKTEEARIKTLEGVTIGNQLVTVHSTNPFVTRNSDPQRSTIKITVKDIPLSYSNDEIKEMLERLGAELSSEIKYSHIRDDNGKLTSLKNGDRFAYAYETPLKDKPLPRKSTCGIYNCRIFHKNQIVQKQSPICRNCWRSDHWTTQCSNPKACMVCKQAGHQEGSSDCEAYTEEHDIRAVFGARDPLSAFHQGEVKVYGVDFSTIEQAYQYTRAIRTGRLDISTKIKEAENPWEVREISKEIKPDDEWDMQKTKVMKEILEAKLKQCQSFVEALKESGTKILVSTKQDNFWGTGLNYDLTNVTKPERWPGRNQYGSILMALRDEIQSGEDMCISEENPITERPGPSTRSSSSKVSSVKSPKQKVTQFFKKTTKHK